MGRDFSALIGRLGDAELEIRKQAVAELRGLQAADVSERVGQAFLRAAVQTFPPAEQFLGDSSSDLVDAAGKKPRAAYVATVRDLYAQYGDAARTAALALLAEIGTDGAIEAYADLLTVHGWRANVFPRKLDGLEAHPRCADVVLPAFFSAAESPAGAYRAFLLLYGLSELGAVRAKHWREYGGHVLARWRRLRPVIESAQRESGVAWKWEEPYCDARSEGGLLLDLLGRVTGKSPDIDCEILAAIGLRDPYLRAFAAVAAIRRRVAIADGTLDSIAENHHARWILFLGSRRLRRREVLPARHRTATAIAYADMVQWLTFGTELGREPDEIELMASYRYSEDGDDGEVFLFRFRTFEPDWAAKDGWMAGVAGPFTPDGDVAGGPSMTFSSFTPWESKAPSEHVTGLRGVIVGYEQAQKRGGEG